MILAKYASQIATGEENAAASVMALYAGLLTEMRPDDIHLDGFGAYKAIACSIVAIDTTETGTKIAMAQMSIGQRLFLGSHNR